MSTQENVWDREEMNDIDDFSFLFYFQPRSFFTDPFPMSIIQTLLQERRFDR